VDEFFKIELGGRRSCVDHLAKSEPHNMETVIDILVVNQPQLK